MPDPLPRYSGSVPGTATLLRHIQVSGVGKMLESYAMQQTQAMFKNAETVEDREGEGIIKNCLGSSVICKMIENFFFSLALVNIVYLGTITVRNAKLSNH